MASQFGEEKVILDYFNGHVGRFLDVGAGDGYRYSNTAPLIEAGWAGVMIEPALDQLEALIGLYGDFGGIDILPGVLTPTNHRGRNWRQFFDGGDYSSAVAHHVEKIMSHDVARVFRPRWAPTLTWADLDRMYPQKFDFINIDVEGWNLAVLEDCSRLTEAQMVCIEYDPVDHLGVLRRILEHAGLNNQEFVGGNLLAWRK